MSVRRVATIAAVAAGLLLAGAAPATSLLPAQKAALALVHRAAAAGRIDASTAAAARAEIGRASRLVRGLPSGRGEHVAPALGAYRAIPGHLLTTVAAGPWIRLYAFNSTPVLNAQLQTVLSLQSYATDAEDAAAGALAARLERAAVATLPRFDTGYW